MLGGCATNNAPVIDGWQQNIAEKSNDYRVEPGDSIYSIAWAFGMDYKDLARFNHLSEPYAIYAGQILHMSAPSYPPAIQAISKPLVVPKPITKPVHITAPSVRPTPSLKEVAAQPPANRWLWPTQGHLIRSFSTLSGGNRGLDIGGKLGQKVSVSAAGKVVYTGSSLPGYGNLIIVKHNDRELSAYAFNRIILVKEGQSVKAGQAIAEMGTDDAGKPMLHFEIRKNGKPVNPMTYLN
jgi:lipoprotein NlpD